MIKAIVDGPGGPTIILGLSEGNLQRLREGKPIAFPGSSIGHPEIKGIVIFWGPTEDTMERDMRRFIDPRTVVIDHRKPTRDQS